MAHRDVKPQNLLLGQPSGGVYVHFLGPRLKLGDFSVAAQMDEDYLVHGTEGTYHFFSPEMCLHQAFWVDFEGVLMELRAVAEAFRLVRGAPEGIKAMMAVRRTSGLRAYVSGPSYWAHCPTGTRSRYEKVVL